MATVRIVKAFDEVKDAAQRATVASLPRVGGLHHRYEWREVA
jgi:hypothetical protein